MKVVVTDWTFPTLDQEERAARDGGAEFAAHQARTAEEVAEAVAGANVALVQFAPFAEAAARAMAPGGTVIRYGVGYDNIDLAATKAAGLRVGYVPDYCADEVAEHTAAMALAMLRKLPQLDQSVRRNDWAAVKVSRPLKPFAETVFGFFGLGQIGRAVLGRLRGMGFRFAAADPGLSGEDAEALGVTLMGMEDLLREADVISLHAPATAETRGYFNAARLETMKPHAVLINSARGQLIDENDLAQALRHGTIGGAALDVFATEPLPPESPLRSAPNCLLSPHAAWYSDAAIGRLQGLVAEDVTRALKGEGPRKPVPG
jgi:D-3-phosphoglycerate dehydrogenase